MGHPVGFEQDGYYAAVFERLKNAIDGSLMPKEYKYTDTRNP